MAEHGHQLRAVQRPAPSRRRVRRPAWLATGAAGTVAGVTAAVIALGSPPAMAAYSVTRHDGTVTVSVYRASGVAGANAALDKMHTRVVVVPVRPRCCWLSPVAGARAAVRWALGAGGIITGLVPGCVSLPSARPGRTRSGSTITVTRPA
jgi:hypothetical protein